MTASRPLTLALLAALLLLAIGGTVAWQHIVAGRIAEAERVLQARTWLSVLPTDLYDDQPLEHPLPAAQAVLEHSTLAGAWQATLQGRPSAVVLHSVATGYEGPIHLLIAIDASARVLAVKTLSQQETPGLGDRISGAGNPWMAQVAQRARLGMAEADWALKRDNGQFDQLAGASVTSRAVVHAVQDALRYFDEHRSQWLTKVAP